MIQAVDQLSRMGPSRIRSDENDAISLDLGVGIISSAPEKLV